MKVRVRTAAVFGVLVSASVFATPAGISGFSGKSAGSNCGACHTGGAAPTVAVTGPTTLAAGATGSYTVTITGGAGANAGVDAAFSGATSAAAAFTAGTGTKVLNGELVQSAAKPFAAGTATFTFTVKAPTAGGMFTLNVAGLSANNNNGPDGDGFATATLNITVPGGGADAGTPAADAGSGPVDAGTVVAPKVDAGTPAVVAQGAVEAEGVVEGEAGCSSTGGAPMLIIVAMLLGALLLRRPARAHARPPRAR